MPPPMPRPTLIREDDQNLGAERRLQVAAALMLGLLVLVAIIWRAGFHNVFPAGWWRAW